MKKILLALLLTILPPLFIIVTTPLSNLSEHITHILLFALLGLAMGGFSLKNEIKGTTIKPRNGRLLPTFSTIVLSVALLFAMTHLLPCPYMFSPHTAQTMIDHPCSQPVPACTPTFSFVIPQTTLTPATLPVLTIAFSEPQQIADNRAPPLS